jgi:hypothetical protein
MLHLTQIIVYKEQRPVSSTSPITLPPRRASRVEWIGFRVSAEEKDEVDKPAERLGVTSSHMARHFLLQAVGYIRQGLSDASHTEGKT